MNQLASGIRSGLGPLVKYPTLSLVAVLTIGLGIGLCTTVFCVVNGARVTRIDPVRALASE
jgi:hypothetical protein